MKLLRENLLLKLLALVTAIIIWMYVTTDHPNPTVKRTVVAKVIMTGTPPSDLIVQLKTDVVTVDVVGQESQLAMIRENDVKAEINVDSVHKGSNQVRVSRYIFPEGASGLTPVQSPVFVEIEVVPRDKKEMPITVTNDDKALSAAHFGNAKLAPANATVSGSRNDIQRVARLAVTVDTNGRAVQDDVPIQALDQDGVIVKDVVVTPATTRIELTQADAAASKQLIVNAVIKGKPAYPYVISSVDVTPDQLTVIGKSELLMHLSTVSTADIPVDGITSDFAREIPVVLPDGVTPKMGPAVVTVSVKVRDSSKPAGN